MSERVQGRFLTQAGVLTHSTTGLPPDVLETSRRRIRVVSGVLAVIMAPLSLGKVIIEGTLVAELENPMDSGPVLLVVLASVAMFLVARSPRLGSATVLRTALVYEVVVSFGLAFSQYWMAFASTPPELIDLDTAGTSLVALWMFLFTVVVPARPRDALVALVLSGAMPGLAYWSTLQVGGAPALDPVQSFFVLVFPYLLAATAAYLAARTIYSLGTDLRRAQHLGSYRLERRLGAGGMGEVWVASHRMLARPAAVKLIRADMLGRDPDTVRTATERFHREAHATADLQSPHTVQLYDYGVTDDGTLYYVMELLDGIDLGALVERHGPVEPPRVVHILRQACASLAEAHATGLVHRDIKPANLYLCRYGLEHDFVKVLDFGLVKKVADEPDSADVLTGVGAITGTPSFLAPEMALGGGTVDGRADLYALGCVGYWLLTGALVFESDTAIGMVTAHVRETPTPPSRRTEMDIPPALDALVMRCLEKDPADRPQSASELDHALAALTTRWTEGDAAAWWRAHRPGDATR